MKIISVVGARPNFMKIAPFIQAIKNYNEAVKLSNPQTPEPSNPQLLEHLLVHTGQHYDDRMSKAFFRSLGIPEADHPKETYRVAATDYEFMPQRGYVPDLDLGAVEFDAHVPLREVLRDHFALFDPLVPGLRPRILSPR